MICFYKTEDNKVVKIANYAKGCWISVVAPTQEELSYLINDLEVDSGFVRAATDEEESSRIENEDNNQTLVIVDIPFKTEEDDAIVYTTMPVGIIITESNVITICLKENHVIEDLANGTVRGVHTQMKTRFVLTLLLRGAAQYLLYLKQIDRISSQVETQLHKSMKNKELIQLLGLEKSLVYFSTSLKANELTLEKILRGRIIKLYEEDQDLLEDVLIEVKQAIEMSNIYSNILSGTMDAFASIISNNLNIVMKVLTSITILMAIPTMVFSFYGMNVKGLWLDQYVWFPLAISAVITIIAAIVLVKNNMFK